MVSLDDDYNYVTVDVQGSPVPARTTWTLLLYLTSAAEGCIGGETVFYPHDRRSAREEIAVELETGTLLLHKHGDDCLLVRNCFIWYNSIYLLLNISCLARGTRSKRGREMGHSDRSLHPEIDPRRSHQECYYCRLAALIVQFNGL